jgi:hypothetical protein
MREARYWFGVMVIIFFLADLGFTESQLPGGFVIDNFDKGTLNDTPKWWTFGNVQCTCTEATAPRRGLYALRVKGTADNYYVGGIGTYIGKDLPEVNTIAMEILGNGLQSGRIKIELYQNDRGNWQMEQDAVGNPLYDACFEFELCVDWHDWRTIDIPLQLFKHSNPGVGADTLKLGYADGNGGLLQYQLVFIAPSATGNVNIGIDNIRLYWKNSGS